MTEVTSLNHYIELQDKWALSIGRFMMVFAECEFYTFLIVEKNGTPAERKRVKQMEVKERAKCACECVLRHSPTKTTRVLRVFRTFESLNGMRKLIAHNTPMVHVYMNDAGDSSFRVEMRSARNVKKTISLKQADNLTTKARKNAGDLLDLLQGISTGPWNQR